MSERYYLSMFKDQPEVLTVIEAAKLLRIGKNQAYDLVRSNKLRAVKVGGKILVPKLRLIDYLMAESA